MKNILEKIWKFINSKFFGYAVTIVLIGMVAGQCKRNTDLKRDNIILNQNITAADTTVKELTNKVGDYEAQKSTWILTEKQLKEKKNELFVLYNEYKKQEGKIISLSRTIISLKQDTAILHDKIRYLTAIIDSAIQIDEELWILPWELKYDWDSTNYDYFKGKTLVKLDTATNTIEHLDTQMDERKTNIDITFGEKVVDGQYNVFITSRYPGLRAEQMQGLLIDPNSNPYIKQLIKKDHWFTGFNIGPQFGVGYDFINNKPTIVLGVGIQYSIYQW